MAPNSLHPSFFLHRLTCCCWKDLSLFLKREGSTKSHPLARKASSPLRSGSRRNDVSLIIMVGAETRNPSPETATDTAGKVGPACPTNYTTAERKTSAKSTSELRYPEITNWCNTSGKHVRVKCQTNFFSCVQPPRAVIQLSFRAKTHSWRPTCEHAGQKTEP